ncbi:TonB-dependent receptor plug domain-containing protein, partial [Flavobacterium rhizosphaerae]
MKAISKKKCFYLLAVAFAYCHIYAAPVAGVAPGISLHMQNARVTEIFSAIEKKTDYTFVFDETISSTSKRFTIHADNEDVNGLLNRLAKATGFSFKTISKTITVTRPQSAQVQVQGRVLDQSGMGMPGALVAEVGTNNTATTDVNGNFTISVSSSNAVLSVSYIGFETVQIAANAASPLSITLMEAANQLNELVVTALGIKREEKKLGYAQQTLNSDDIDGTVPNNWSSALKGKVAGLNIISSGSGPLNSQDIVLRGGRSLDPKHNRALIVVDGVMMTSEMTTSGSSTAYMGDDSPIDYGNSINDLNLDDIESVTVLKGAGATALYGERAANGAIIITTKSGKKAKGLGVTINSGATFDVIQRWPDYQYKYGQGAGSSFDENGDPYYSYGAAEDGIR